MEFLRNGGQKRHTQGLIGDRGVHQAGVRLGHSRQSEEFPCAEAWYRDTPCSMVYLGNWKSMAVSVKLPVMWYCRMRRILDEDRTGSWADQGAH